MADSIPSSQNKKKLKKCNFSKEEIVLIQREVGNHYTIINSKHSNIITNEKKNGRSFYFPKLNMS
jgi:Mor family transcriptional regulator